MIRVKFIYLIFILIISIKLNAQIEQGSLMTGGSARFMQRNNVEQNNKVLNFEIRPVFEYFFINNFSIGLNPSWEVLREKSDRNGYELIDKSNRLGLSPSLNYYFLSDKFHPYIFFEYGYNISKFEGEGLDNGDIYKSYQDFIFVTYSPGVGMLYFLNQNVGVDLKVRYTIYNNSFTYTNQIGVESKGESKSRGINLLAGFKIII